MFKFSSLFQLKATDAEADSVGEDSKSVGLELEGEAGVMAAVTEGELKLKQTFWTVWMIFLLMTIVFIFPVADLEASICIIFVR